ncbi:MAG TPA: thiol:disulfide interchange protein DsbA/DsbL [Dongiaceae bacterium]|nr:thiol:disulfide interchange protein DsbA/DsbL [Dongiaceae bacterium]
MKKLFIWLPLLLMVLGLHAGAAVAETYAEGVDYEVLEKPGKVEQADKLEVREFFWYGCPHCFQLEAPLEEWAKNLPADVHFVRTPAPMNERWVSQAHAFYVAESIGKLDQISPALFNAIHVKKENISSQEELAAFFKDFGVSEEDFNKRYNSFSVRTKVRQARTLAQQYALRGVPAIIVNGKYLVKGKEGSGPASMLRVAEFLLEKERVGKAITQPAK